LRHFRKCAEYDGLIKDGKFCGERVDEIVGVYKEKVRLCCRIIKCPRIGLVFPPGSYRVDRKVRLWDREGDFVVRGYFRSDRLFGYVWRGEDVTFVRKECKYDCYAEVLNYVMGDNKVKVFVFSNVPVEWVVTCNGKVVKRCVSYWHHTIEVDKKCKKYGIWVENGVGDKVWWVRVVKPGVQAITYGCVR